MAMKCSNCKKGIMYGHNVSHSKRRTVRTFKPNLHASRIEVNGNMVQMKLCTKCLRTVKKTVSVNKAAKAASTPESQVLATA